MHKPDCKLGWQRKTEQDNKAKMTLMTKAIQATKLTKTIGATAAVKILIEAYLLCFKLTTINLIQKIHLFSQNSKKLNACKLMPKI